MSERFSDCIKTGSPLVFCSADILPREKRKQSSWGKCATSGSGGQKLTLRWTKVVRINEDGIFHFPLSSIALAEVKRGCSKIDHFLSAAPCALVRTAEKYLGTSDGYYTQSTKTNI